MFTSILKMDAQKQERNCKVQRTTCMHNISYYTVFAVTSYKSCTNFEMQFEIQKRLKQLESEYGICCQVMVS